MTLEDLGLDAHLQAEIDTTKLSGSQLARVMVVNKDSYVIRNETSEVAAEITGKFMFTLETPTDYPTVGDWVYAQYLDDDSFAIIHELLPRKSLLRRKTAGKKVDFQLIAANIDIVFVMQSLDANFNVRRLERYLVMINEAKIHPMLLLSKSDLLPPQELAEKIEEVRSSTPELQIIAFSNTDGSGLERIEDLMVRGQTYCFLGSSGVGKTTLLNNLLEEDSFKTQAVREGDGRGRHTTTRRQLCLLKNGALVVDTPGMRELGNMSVESGLQETFTEITELAKDCRFKDCTHTRENGCAILPALKDGRIQQERYGNYIKMIKESAFYEMSHQDKRRRDKKFGKLYKSIMKHSVKKPKH